MAYGCFGVALANLILVAAAWSTGKPVIKKHIQKHIEKHTVRKLDNGGWEAAR